jgi:4-amino-4-deoxy-L-arabinose transferase-like glycosyltransferase
MDTQLRRLWVRVLWSLLIAIAIGILAFGAAAWRLDRAPDIFTDEILYTRAGIRMAGEGALVWDRGDPIFVHPPLYFLAEGVYWRLTGDAPLPLYAPGDIFASVYQARYLNAALAGFTASLLYLIGWRLHSIRLGLFLAALFFLDPFGLRINRRAMLETMAGLLALAGMAVLLAGVARENRRRWLPRAIIAGLLFGAALLTKELTFTAVLAVLIFGLWQVWKQRRIGEEERQSARERARAAFTAVAVAGLTYSLYPAWMVSSGNWVGFAEVKALSLERLFGFVQISGWNRSGVSLASFLGQRLADYGSSYVLLAVGAAATLWLLLRRREDPHARLLGVWGLVLYPFYGFVTLFGSGNDQFFYLLLVPAILLVGYALSTVSGTATESRFRRPSTLVVGILLALVLSYNTVRWWGAYGVGVDDAYHQLAEYVQGHLPPGEALNASGDAIKFQYFFPDRPITTAATPEEAQSVSVHYFALAPKDITSRYGRMTAELGAWLAAQGEQLYAVSGDSYGDIFLYRADSPVAPSAPMLTAVDAGPRQRAFGLAQSGFVVPLLLALGLWVGITSCLAVWLNHRPALFIAKRWLRQGSSAKGALEAEHEHA